MAKIRAQAIAAGLLALLLAAGTCPAQADLHLYHQAWYQEQVAKSPERALELYARLCRDFPESPLRRFALGRQASLLLRLDRPKQARPILRELRKQGFDKVAKKDQETLEWAMQTLAARQELLNRIKALRRRHGKLKKELTELQRRGATPAEKSALADRIQAMEKELAQLRPRLERIIPRILSVKQMIMEGGLTSLAARKQIEVISELRDRARALEEEGKLKEAARVREALEREERAFRRQHHRRRPPGREGYKRLIQSFQATPLHRVKAFLEGKPFFSRVLLIWLVTSPERLEQLDPAGRRRVTLSLGIIAGDLAERLGREGRKTEAAKIRSLWKNLQELIRRGDYQGAHASLKNLTLLFRKYGRPPRRPPDLRPGPKRPKRPL